MYDPLDPDRSDLDVYVAIADELGARRVLDVGCGTGTFALLLAGKGLEVTGVDPAKASLDVARAKPGAERVSWIHGDASALPALEVDLATMTGNAAQAIVDEHMWDGTLRGVFDALRPGGHLRVRDERPCVRSLARVEPRRVLRDHGDRRRRRGRELGRARPPWSFRSSPFAGPSSSPTGTCSTSDSTLRFRERDDVHADLTLRTATSWTTFAMRRTGPGREFVFFARRPELIAERLHRSVGTALERSLVSARRSRTCGRGRARRACAGTTSSRRAGPSSTEKRTSSTPRPRPRCSSRT